MMDWLASGRPLRLWLMGALKSHLRERIRAERRWRRGLRWVQHRTDDGDPERAFDRASALSIVSVALERAKQSCAERSLDEHWGAFVLRRVRRKSIKDAAAALDVSPRRVVVMDRTAAVRFRAALRDIIAWEGASPGQLDQDIRTLMEALKP